MYDVMLDLETLGTKPGCVVLSIGACIFNRSTGTVSKTFYRVIDMQSCLTNGLVIDQSTWDWWLQQSENSRLILNNKKAQPLKTVLQDFDSFLSDITYRKQDIVMWGNGSDFDQPILSACYDKLSMTYPWLHYNNRCHRTFKNEKSGIKPEFSGTKHNALDDALYQVKQHALVYQAIYNIHPAIKFELDKSDNFENSETTDLKTTVAYISDDKLSAKYLKNGCKNLFGYTENYIENNVSKEQFIDVNDFNISQVVGETMSHCYVLKSCYSAFRNNVELYQAVIRSLVTVALSLTCKPEDLITIVG